MKSISQTKVLFKRRNKALDFCSKGSGSVTAAHDVRALSQ